MHRPQTRQEQLWVVAFATYATLKYLKAFALSIFDYASLHETRLRPNICLDLRRQLGGQNILAFKAFYALRCR